MSRWDHGDGIGLRRLPGTEVAQETPIACRSVTMETMEIFQIVRVSRLY